MKRLSGESTTSCREAIQKIEDGLSVDGRASRNNEKRQPESASRLIKELGRRCLIGFDRAIDRVVDETSRYYLLGQHVVNVINITLGIYHHERSNYGSSDAEAGLRTKASDPAAGDSFKKTSPSSKLTERPLFLGPTPKWIGSDVADDIERFNPAPRSKYIGGLSVDASEVSPTRREVIVNDIVPQETIDEVNRDNENNYGNIPWIFVRK